MFNTLKYAKILQDAGFSKEQAETSIGVLVDVMEQTLATQQDLKNLETSVKEDMTEFRSDFKEFKTEMIHEFKSFKSDMTIRLGGMIGAAVALITALNKLF